MYMEVARYLLHTYLNTKLVQYEFILNRLKHIINIKYSAIEH